MAKPRSKWNGDVFHRRIDEGIGTGGRIANDAESYFHIGDGLGLTSFQRLLFEKKLVIPLDKPLDLMAPRLYREQKGGWHSCLETYQ